jgi:hypothetical protein
VVVVESHAPVDSVPDEAHPARGVAVDAGVSFDQRVLEGDVVGAFDDRVVATVDGLAAALGRQTAKRGAVDDQIGRRGRLEGPVDAIVGREAATDRRRAAEGQDPAVVDDEIAVDDDRGCRDRIQAGACLDREVASVPHDP